MDNAISLLDEALKEVSIIGASGKMGKSISLLLLQEMASSEIEHHGKTGTGLYRLHLIDSNDRQFLQLKEFLRTHITKYAEKRINWLRECYAKNPLLISNEEMIEAFVEGALNSIDFDTELYRVKDSRLVFEAIIEDLQEKIRVFSALDAICGPSTYFFTNTSSIPISVLQDRGMLGDKLIGYHFYNPPHIQKLLEIIYPKEVDPSLKEMALELAKRMKKVVVISQDVAGFIGNGHFMREIQFACRKLDELTKQYSLLEAIIMVNRVTQEGLLRPMGIFQLLDYVGLDVCQKISKIMSDYFPSKKFQVPLVDQMVTQGVLGGQYPDGSQKDGFFKYEKNILVGIYSLQEKKYLLFKESDLQSLSEVHLGEFLEKGCSWKTLSQDLKKQEKIASYFHHLEKNESLGGQLTKAFLDNSKKVGQELVDEGVCSTVHDVDTVLQNGFYHLYGVEKR